MMSFFVTSEDLTQTYKMTSSDVKSVEKLTSLSTHTAINQHDNLPDVD